jgi:CHASE1-domain containing sensor protein
MPSAAPTPTSLSSDSVDGASALFRARAAVLVLIVGTILSVLAFLAVRTRDQEKAEAEFTRHAQNFLGVASDRLKRHQETLFSLRSLFHFSGEVSRSEFSGAARELITRHPGVQALEWIARVPASQRTAV